MVEENKMRYDVDISDFIDVENLKSKIAEYGTNPPFDHVIIDGFFHENIAKELEKEFPEFDSEIWHGYENPLEIKKLCNTWNSFPTVTYKAFSLLNSKSFVEILSTNLLSGKDLFSDSGLNGGGWHIHKKGGKLNTHLDYSLHPKMKLQRKLNIIIYMNSNWKKEWGGSLGLWDNKHREKPGELVTSVWCKFNRAVIFDTTQNSWHGLPEPLNCPEGESRKSLAAYYLCLPPKDVDERGKALFAPTKEQEGDAKILELIKKRSNIETASSVYKKQ